MVDNYAYCEAIKKGELVMDIHADPRSIVGLFPVSENDIIKYKIPLYQRKYSWSNENIRELLEDIYQEDKGYYIGNLLVRNSDSNDKKTFEVIDGQQRLTTLMLAMIAIRDFFKEQDRNNNVLSVLQNMKVKKEVNPEEMLDLLKEYAKNSTKKEEILELLGEPVDENGKPPKNFFGKRIATKMNGLNNQVRSFYGIGNEVDLTEWDGLNRNEKDNIKIKDDIDRQLKTEDKSKSRLELLEDDKGQYDYFVGIGNDNDRRRLIAKRFKAIKEELSNLCNNEIKQYKDFYDKLSSLTILQIRMTDLSDTFNVFSSLNGKGTPLTLLDLLKSDYMRIFSKNEEENKSEENQNKIQKNAIDEWNNLLKNFQSISDRQVNSKAVTQFLQNNYDTFISEKKSSITKREVLKRYKEKFSNSGNDYLKELSKTAEIFSIIAPNIHKTCSDDFKLNDKIEEKIEKLQKLEASQAYPLMLYLLNGLRENTIAETEVIRAFDYLIKFYVRRNVVSKPKASNIRSAILSIIRSLQNDEIYVSDIPKKLTDISVSDEEFKLGISDLRYDYNKSIIRYLLNNLERKHGSYFDKQNKDTLDDRKTWTIDHILPKTTNLKHGWPKMIATPEEIKAGKVREIQAEHMHKIGNLTLTGYNSEMSDHSFKEKRDYKNKNGNYSGYRTDLFLNKSISDKEE